MVDLRILIVDDETVLNRVMSRGLMQAHESWTIVTEDNSTRALNRILAGEHYDIIMLDIIMADLTGIGFFATLQEKKPELCWRVIFITGGSLIPAVIEFLRTVPNKVLEKPFSYDEATDAIRGILGNGVA